MRFLHLRLPLKNSVIIASRSLNYNDIRIEVLFSEKCEIVWKIKSVGRSLNYMTKFICHIVVIWRSDPRLIKVDDH